MGTGMGVIAHTLPYNFIFDKLHHLWKGSRRLAEENTAFLKVRILGNDGEAIILGVLPNGGIIGAP
jgi:hypothetical protein